VKDGLKRKLLIVLAQLLALFGGCWLGHWAWDLAGIKEVCLVDIGSAVVGLAAGFCAGLFLKSGWAVTLCGISAFHFFKVWESMRWYQAHGFTTIMFGIPRDRRITLPATADLLHAQAVLDSKEMVLPAALLGLLGWFLARLLLRRRAIR